MITLHLMHNQTLVRQGMSQLLQKVPGIQVTGESRTTAELLEAIDNGLQVDVVLLALLFADFRRINYQQIKDLTSAKILLMARLEDDICPSNAIQAGADGYMLEDACLDETVFAIKYLAQGKPYMSSPIGFALQKFALSRLKATENISLSKRELEILNLIGEGLTNQEIADKLFTSKRTVEGHRNNLLHKTGTRNTAALMKFVMSGNIANFDIRESSGEQLS